MNLRNIEDVVKWRMCIGCGACAYVCPEKKIKLVNFIEEGIRPIITSEGCYSCSTCLDVCPGFETIQSKNLKDSGYYEDIFLEWGPIVEVWEGYSSDKDIHYNGSSAGVTTSIALYCIEQKNMRGVLHIGADPNNPLINKTYFSKTRYDLLARTGSRYAPASPCDSLEKIEKEDGLCVFIGKPCDVRGIRKSQKLNHLLNENVGLTVSIFCAGTPSTRGTLDLLKNTGINEKNVKEIRYRGRGWPGKFVAIMDNGRNIELSYQDSWGFLQAYRPYRCHLCPEGTGDAADISCGDPWYRDIQENEKGSSLIIVRNEIGLKILYDAIQGGYIIAQRVNPSVITKSQYNLLSRKKAIWGRLLAFKIMGIPHPKFKGFYLLKNWMSNSIEGKMKSILGTLKRILIRKYYRANENY